MSCQYVMCCSTWKIVCGERPTLRPASSGGSPSRACGGACGCSSRTAGRPGLRVRSREFLGMDAVDGPGGRSAGESGEEADEQRPAREAAVELGAELGHRGEASLRLLGEAAQDDALERGRDVRREGARRGRLLVLDRVQDVGERAPAERPGERELAVERDAER